MSVRLGGLFLLVISMIFLQGCNETQVPNNGSTEKQARFQTLDLKGFQIIREKQSDGQVRPEIFDNRPFDVTPGDFLLSDKIFVNTPPPSDVRLETVVSCGESLFVDQDNQLQNIQYQQTSDHRFDRPIEVLQVIPESALYRIHDQSNDGLSCHFKLRAYNALGSEYNPSNSPDESQNQNHPGGFKRVYASGPNRLSESLILSYNGSEVGMDGRQIPKGEITEVMVWSERLNYQDIEFNRIKLMCETYSLEHKYSQPIRQTTLRDLDFDLALIKEKYKFTQHDTFSRQTCRLFTYNEKRLVGVSAYFDLLEDQFYPEVEFRYSGARAYSDGFKKSDAYRPTIFAELVVSNPHETPLAVGLDPSRFQGFAQFITAIQHTRQIEGTPRLSGAEYNFAAREGNNVTFYSDQRSVVYRVFPQFTLATEQGVQATGKLSPGRYQITKAQEDGSVQTLNYGGEGNRPYSLFILRPGEKVKVEFSFNDTESRCWFHDRGNTGKNSPVGARGTYGVILQAISPRIDLRELKPSAIEDFDSPDSYRPAGPASEPLALDDHFLYSTTRTDGNWMAEFAFPSERLRLRRQTPQGERNPLHICRENNFFIQ